VSDTGSEAVAGVVAAYVLAGFGDLASTSRNHSARIASSCRARYPRGPGTRRFLAKMRAANRKRVLGDSHGPLPIRSGASIWSCYLGVLIRGRVRQMAAHVADEIRLDAPLRERPLPVIALNRS